ncbi:DUF1604-domain-containing protein [Cutaneotrichosporon oleaginosum]|uniref:DUF1604-domain-containing protein n=1 Tax=Cutaneotrichosporon oleaginosum TaxID=879819 RepID=A0A0J0XKB4_9TREE|nr:DUF1604-domain-containing protein [Cutaneotrichosporon oleaginosum]KLT41563.1 DUF1604-domain-containing protein [Cutaneotrichosporon oleaginosum]TXT09329.1 hypothetical protein COLE_03263 [Cutaneotrichosporon oleaginosum]
MTSRLKHKLELENVNLKSAYLNQSFVQIGTPLPALSDHKKDKQEFLPVWQQEARDEKGRRRFHGAFTGGWSAGYFNTVGSKEGWTPSTFKSSRSSRATYQQSAEDFMDEEDRQQMNEDRQLQNTETFQPDAFAGERSLGDKSLSSALESLVIPAKSSVGHLILQKLGWRPGQGIGPRVTLRKLKVQEGKLGRVRAGLEADMDDEAEASKHLYAPRDTRLLVYDSKDDRSGLGYEKGRGMGAIPRKQSTWVAGEDDHDPYGADATDRTHYVFDDEDVDGDMIVLGQPGASNTVADGARNAASAERWHDGRPVLAGFALDPKGVPTETWWAFPDIPSDWQPSPSRVWDAVAQTARQLEHSAAPKEALRGEPGRPLSHGQRGVALGEEQRVSSAKSVWEYISEKDRERLQAFAAAAKTKAAAPPLSLSRVEEQELPPERATEVVIPPLSPRTASAALQGFMPYSDDSEKQERYKSYLRSQTYNTKTPFPTLLPSASVNDINQELETFSQSARVFRPMSYALSSRFTSGSSSLASSDSKVPRPGLHLYDPSNASDEFSKPQSTEIEIQQSLTPRQQAAQDGNYGPLTRVVKDFYPVKLVCRRFHVPDPHPEGPPPGEKSGTATPTTLQSAEPLSFESQFTHQAGTEVETRSEAPSAEEGERVPTTLGEVGMADDVNQGRDILTYTKPSIDIFKAIFASDDEEDDDDEPAATTAVVVLEEKPEDPFPVEEGPLDYNTFKPMFRRNADERKEEVGKRKKDKKKKRKGVLSFDVGDEGEETASFKPKKKVKPSRAEDDAGGEWVEKVAPGQQTAPILGSSSVAVQEAALTKSEQPDHRPRKSSPARGGRKGAADFM